jgi:hypothetical protein
MSVLSRREFSLRCPPTDRGYKVLPAAYHWSIAPLPSLLDDGLGRYLSISSRTVCSGLERVVISAGIRGHAHSRRGPMSMRVPHSVADSREQFLPVEWFPE